MNGSFNLLIAAALVWLGIHVGISGTPLRARLIAALGDKGFLGVYSLLSVASIAALCASYAKAPATLLWDAPVWLRWALVAVMLPAFVLLVGSVVKPNPTAVGSELRPAGDTQDPVRGIFRVTRHPMLCAFALWAVVHVIANGSDAALIFFGTFAVTALVGMPSIDAKLAQRDPARWAPLAAHTSIIPGGAIAAGRNRLVLSEIGWLTPVIGIVVWALVLGAHPHVIGVAALPLGL